MRTKYERHIARIQRFFDVNADKKAGIRKPVAIYEVDYFHVLCCVPEVGFVIPISDIPAALCEAYKVGEKSANTLLSPNLSGPLGARCEFWGCDDTVTPHLIGFNTDDGRRVWIKRKWFPYFSGYAVEIVFRNGNLWFYDAAGFPVGVCSTLRPK